MRISILILFCAASLWGESAAGLRWTMPAGWKSEGARPMRAATYDVAPVPGDRDPAECGVYFFGPGQGGSVAANMERWKSQFLTAAGKPADAKIATRSVHGVTMTTLDTSGAYTGMGGPTAPGGPAKPAYRMLGAIVEGPGGNIFIKFTGQVKTIAANQAKFEELLASFAKDGK